MRSGKVFIKDVLAGKVWESEGEFGFQYDAGYVEKPVHGPVSFTMPVKEGAYVQKTMLPFFDGLIPEGWLLNVAAKNWKLNPRDRMELLLTVCKDCIGDVSVERIEHD
jgi:serine/threonine-protein kinase HipA